MCKLSILTATIGSILVLIPQLALPVSINAVENTCTFRNVDGELVTVTGPDKLKVVQRGGNSPQATCIDASEDVGLTTDGGPPITYKGGAFQCPCFITIPVDGAPVDYCATRWQRIDKKGATLKCQGL